MPLILNIIFLEATNDQNVIFCSEFLSFIEMYGLRLQTVINARVGSLMSISVTLISQPHSAALRHK